jgi:iron complex outermembrane recepter protein
MKKLFLGICYCLVSLISFSQQIRGKITTSSGSAVQAATVEMENVATVISNDSGFFAFNKVPPGSHVLTISSVGFRPYRTTVSPARGFVEVKLSPLDLFMQPVEVRALRAGDKAPFAKTNISEKEIARLNQGKDLPFLLNQTPSVVINSDAGNGIGYTGIRIRGSDATRINMTINGIPYNDAESQGLFFVNLPDLASSVNSIQIQRGVGTSSNGAGAFGATINFNTNEVNTEPYANINNSYGSFNSWKNTVKAGTGIMNDHFTIDARLSRISSDGYVDRASTDLKSFYVSAAYLAPKTSLRLNILSGKEKTYQAWNGVTAEDLKTNRTVNYLGMDRPGAPYDNQTDNYQQDHYQFFINHQFNPKLTFNTAFFLTNGKGYYEEYKADQEFASYGLPDFVAGGDTISSTDLIRQLWLDNRLYGQTLSVQYKDLDNELTVGGAWNRYDGKHYGIITWAELGVPDHYKWYNLTAHKNDVNGYAKYQRRLSGDFYGFVDLQLRNVRYEINGFRDNPSLHILNNYNFFNPKLGFSYVHDGSTVYASYSQTSKEPNRDDFEAGREQQPKPEQLRDIELGYELRRPTHGFGATIFYMSYKDQLVLTGKINDVGAYTRTNIPNSFRTGIELQGNKRFTKWLNAVANLTLSRNRIENFTEYFDDYDNGGQKAIEHGNTDISYSPAVTAAAAIEFYPLPNFQISLPGKYVSRQYLDNTSDNARSLNSFYVQDLNMSYTVHKKLLKEINIVLQVNNVFNKKYEPNGYTYSYIYGGSLVTENYYFPMAGTNYMVGLNLSL